MPNWFRTLLIRLGLSLLFWRSLTVAFGYAVNWEVQEEYRLGYRTSTNGDSVAIPIAGFAIRLGVLVAAVNSLLLLSGGAGGVNSKLVRASAQVRAERCTRTIINAGELSPSSRLDLLARVLRHLHPWHVTLVLGWMGGRFRLRACRLAPGVALRRRRLAPRS